MDKSAIAHIQQSSGITEILSAIKEQKTQVPLMLAMDNMKVSSLEDYMPNASRYRLCFRTDSIEDFLEYNTLHDQEGASCFIDPDQMSAISVFDLGTVDLPGHMQNKAKLELIRSSQFRAVWNINGDHLRQKEAGEFIEDWADNIVAYALDGEKMLTTKAVRSLQNLTIESAREVNSTVSDFGESMTAMERIEAKDKDNIPAFIDFTCEPYRGLPKRTFRLRVGILTGGDKPQIKFRIIQAEQAQEEMAKEFKKILVEGSENLTLKSFIGHI